MVMCYDLCLQVRGHGHAWMTTKWQSYDWQLSDTTHYVSAEDFRCNKFLWNMKLSLMQKKISLILLLYSIVQTVHVILLAVFDKNTKLCGNIFTNSVTDMWAQGTCPSALQDAL